MTLRRSRVLAPLLLALCVAAAQAKPPRAKPLPPPEPLGARPAIVAFADELAAR